MEIEIEIEKPVKSLEIRGKINTKCLKGYFSNLFCGFDWNSKQIGIENEVRIQNQNEIKRRIEGFHSLKQTNFELFTLNFNLIIILFISISLFIFFSIPPQLHIFKHIHLNNTLSTFNLTVDHY